jgi:hypothetical protein
MDQLGNSSNAPDVSGQNLGENGEKEDMISTQGSEGGNGSSQIVRESGGTVPELSTNNGTNDEFVDCSGNDSGNSAGNDDSGVRKSGRARRAPGWANCALISTTTDPTTIHQAIKRPDSTQWKVSMQCEYNSLMKHETWTLVPRPVNVNIIASKWVFKTKVVRNNSDLDITKYKSRLVAKGYSKLQRVDYEEAFAPVVKFTSIRILLALVTHFNLELHQMDVATAFLNGVLDEIIHMEQPEGFVKADDTDKVCRLPKRFMD